MCRGALEIVLDHEVSAAVRGDARRPCLGRALASLELALCKYSAPYLGVRSHVCRLKLLHCGRDLVRAVRSTSAELLPLEDVLKYTAGHLRYVALKAGGHLESPRMEDLVAWLRGRPYELWYAIQDARQVAAVRTPELLALLPSAAVASVLAADGADAAFKISGRDCSHLCALLEPAHVAMFVQRHPFALVGYDWLADNIADKVVLFAVVSVKVALGHAHPTAAHLERMRLREDHLWAVLYTTRLRCESEWLLRMFGRRSFYLVEVLKLSDRLSELGPDWLKANVQHEGALTYALRAGGHVCSLEWLAENVDREYLPAALIDRECEPAWLSRHVRKRDMYALLSARHLAGCAPDWLAEHVESAELPKALLRGGHLASRSPEWLAQRVQGRHLYCAMVCGGHMAAATKEWIARRLPPKDAVLALHTYGHSVDAAFLRACFRGGYLLDALIKFGMDVGARASVEELRAAYGRRNVLRALTHLGRLGSEPLSALATALDPDQMTVVMVDRGCSDEDEYARYLGGRDLLSALLNSDLLDAVPVDWLCERFEGDLLLSALDLGGHLEHLDAEVIVEVLPAKAAFEALRRAGTLGTLSAELCFEAFRGTEHLLPALLSSWELPACDPSVLRAMFGVCPELWRLVKRTLAFERMDPDDFESFGYRAARQEARA